MERSPRSRLLGTNLVMGQDYFRIAGGSGITPSFFRRAEPRATRTWPRPDSSDPKDLTPQALVQRCTHS